MAKTLAAVEAETLGEARACAQTVDENLADTLAEVEAVTFGDTLCNAQAMMDTLADSEA